MRSFHGKYVFTNSINIDDAAYEVDAEFDYHGMIGCNNEAKDVSVEVLGIAVTDNDGNIYEDDKVDLLLREKIECYLTQFIAYCFDTDSLEYIADRYYEED